jgi:hypothetical protein
MRALEQVMAGGEEGAKEKLFKSVINCCFILPPKN